MPLVFVHGVNVRHGELYERELAFRNRHFTEILYPQLGRRIDPKSIFNPYWGDLGASLSEDAPFLPRGRYTMLWRNETTAATSNKQSDAKAIDQAQDPSDVGIQKSGRDARATGDLDEGVNYEQNYNSDERLDIHFLDDSLDDHFLDDHLDSNSQTPLIDMARTASLADVIDILWTLVDEDVENSESTCAETSQEIARLAQRALDFAHSQEGEEWLQNLKTDDELLAELSTLLHSSTTQPKNEGGKQVADLIKTAGRKLKDRMTLSRQRVANTRKQLKENVFGARLRIRQRAVSTTARIFNEPVRAIFHKQCALLIGDAFAYFSTRGDNNQAAPIAQRVIDTLREAQKIKEETGEELIVIGHSMGGVILCDIVSCYGKDIPIDVLITVGSQFPLFADLQMFPGTNGVKRPIPKPANVKKWINIFDPHDFLGYPASHIFSDVSDFHLPTYALGASSHTNYFNRTSFYFQLARRLAEQ